MVSTPYDFGYVSGQDATDALQAWLECGDSHLIAPPGEYLITYRGPSLGGVRAELMNSTSVYCSGARFKAVGGLDASMITLTSGSAGLDVLWSGGYFDMSDQANGLVPYEADFPVKNRGQSDVCNGLNIDGSGSPGTRCFETVVVRDAEVYAAPHWLESPGGDSGFGIKATRTMVLTRLVGTGIRDLMIYPSGHSDFIISNSSLSVTHCQAIGCMGGISAKRAMSTVNISRCSFEKTLFPIGVSFHSNWDIAFVSINDNTATGSQTMVSVDGGYKVRVFDNALTRSAPLDRFGKSLSGSTGILSVSPCMVELAGADMSRVFMNKLSSGNTSTELIRFKELLPGKGTRRSVAYKNKADVAAISAIEGEGCSANIFSQNRSNNLELSDQERISPGSGSILE